MNFNVTFTDLMTAVLTSGKSSYILNMPDILLTTEYEIKAKKFIAECANNGFVPSVNRFKEVFNFSEGPNDLPIDVVYQQFGRQRAEVVLITKTQEFMVNNKKNNKPELEGLLKFNEEITRQLRLPDPKVVDYNKISRASYINTNYRSKFGVPYMDDYTNGLIGGDFVAVIAPPKAGKTVLLKTLIAAAFKQGENIIVCSQEQSPISLAQQLDMESLGMSSKSIRGGIDEEMMAKLVEVEKAARNRKNKMFITPKIGSVAELDSYIKALGVPVHKVFIDGLNLMAAYGDMYNNLSQACADLKAYANAHNLIVIGVSHTNRGSVDKEELSSADIAGSFMISGYVDFLMGLVPVEIDGQRSSLLHMVDSRWDGHDMRILLTEVTIKSLNSRYIEFGKIDPSWRPDESSVGYALRQAQQLRQSLNDMKTEEIDVNARLAQAMQKSLDGMKVEGDF